MNYIGVFASFLCAMGATAYLLDVKDLAFFSVLIGLVYAVLSVCEEVGE